MWSRMAFLKIQDGGGRLLGKYTNGHISAKSGLICTKFGVQIDMGHSRVIGCQKWYYFWKFNLAV